MVAYSRGRTIASQIFLAKFGTKNSFLEGKNWTDLDILKTLFVQLKADPDTQPSFKNLTKVLLILPIEFYQIAFLKVKKLRVKINLDLYIEKVG